MAYDAADGKVVLFGGSGRYALNDTWIWDGTYWTQQHPVHSPPKPYGQQLAYDSATGLIVLYETYLRRTWTWDGTDWTEQHPAHSPPQRSVSSMAATADGHVVLYGGTNGNGILDDTWTWDGTDWTQQHPAHTPSLFDTSMTYDAADVLTVLVGGYRENEGPVSETWTWNGTDWTQQHPVHEPTQRDYRVIAYEPAHGTVVLFGGEQSATGHFLGDTWTWDGTDWTQRLQPANNLPLPRIHQAMSPSVRGEVLLFGGERFIQPYALGDTWTWDGNVWTEHPGGSVKLIHRSGPPGSLVYVWVSGYAAYEHVQVSFLDSVNGGTLLGTISTDGTGGGTMYVRVPENATQGLQRFKSKGLSTGQVAKARFRVT
jgi:hypothetical protein